MVTTENLAS